VGETNGVARKRLKKKKKQAPGAGVRNADGRPIQYNPHGLFTHTVHFLDLGSEYASGDESGEG
jgi:hypothetical protein